ncbi:MAG: CPBP family intramembrane metalloprotease [Candidatus Kapabacteria bacterium]|nr:CPBP family intramembrane metalloprotease [Candidatus Kapabacteria bacterium]
MVVKVLDLWWIRICVMLASVFVPTALLTFVVHGDDAGAVIQSSVYGLCVVVMIGIEVLRPYGSAVASGVVPTPISPRFVGLGVGWALASLIAIASVTYLLGGSVAATTVSVDVTSVSTVVLFAIGEEVLFRGTIFRALEERFSSSFAVLATSLPFALIHLLNPGASWMSAVNVFLAGLALGTSVALTRSLWMAISFHVFWNLGLALMFGLVSGLDLPLSVFVLDVSSIPEQLRFIITGPFGVEDGLLTSVLLFASVVIMQKMRVFDPVVQAARFMQKHSVTR